MVGIPFGTLLISVPFLPDLARWGSLLWRFGHYPALSTIVDRWITGCATWTADHSRRYNSLELEG